MNSVMISVNPPYTDLFCSGEKLIEFRKQILNEMKEGKMPIVYIYETKNFKGSGKVIGMIDYYNVYKPMYIKNKKLSTDPTDLIQERFALIKKSYYNYCEYKCIKSNKKEGWFKSKKFIEHEKKIGEHDQQFNYAIEFPNIYFFDKPIDLSKFNNCKGIPLKYPPQNMYYCIPPDLYYVYQTEPGLGCVTTTIQYLENIGITEDADRAKQILLSYIKNYHLDKTI